MQLRTVLAWLIKLFIIVGIIFIIARIEQLNNNIQSIPSNKEIIRDSLVRDTLNHTKDSLTIKIVKIRETYEDKKAIIRAANECTTCPPADCPVLHRQAELEGLNKKLRLEQIAKEHEIAIKEERAHS